MFYFSDIKPDIRRLLNDEYTTYRFREDELRDYSLKAVLAIYRERPDAKIDKRGRLRKEKSVYLYTSTAYNLSELDRIQGWDRYTQDEVFVIQTTSSITSFFPTATDRTNGTNRLGYCTDTDTVGIKSVREDNDSTWDGTLKVDKVATIADTWEITVEEQAYELDDFFREAVIEYVVARCYGQDNADTYNAGREVEHTNKFMRELR